jgi:hypothetical protein
MVCRVTESTRLVSDSVTVRSALAEKRHGKCTYFDSSRGQGVLLMSEYSVFSHGNCALGSR